MVILLMRITYVSYSTFAPLGKVLAWFISFGSVLALGSLAMIITRLYVSPILAPQRARRKRNA